MDCRVNPGNDAVDGSAATVGTMSGEIFFAAAGMGRKVRGQALVAKDGFSARYDLDRLRGVFSRPDHKLAGESYVGRVLVLDAAKGGVATAWMLREMKARGVRRLHHDLRFRPRHHAGDCKRRDGGGRPDRRAAVHPGDLRVRLKRV